MFAISDEIYDEKNICEKIAKVLEDKCKKRNINYSTENLQDIVNTFFNKYFSKEKERILHDKEELSNYLEQELELLFDKIYFDSFNDEQKIQLLYGEETFDEDSSLD